MTLTRVKLERFTAFKELDLEFSPGINVFVGDNGAGKTHLLKVCYAACDVSKTRTSFADKLIDLFLPSDRVLGRLVYRQKGSFEGVAEVFRDKTRLKIAFSNHVKRSASAKTTGENLWSSSPIETVYIPVKEMLANAPGFLSLYAQRETHFEAVYADILQRAYLPLLRGPMGSERERLFTILKKVIEGQVTLRNEEFFLRSKQGNIEFPLLAEGIRKLGLLWILIRNGVLQQGSVLFWDEPETNLNPSRFGVLMEIMLELQRMGVQIFLATHDYVILKELDLRQKEGDEVAFHSLYRSEETGDVACRTTDAYLGIDPNAIADTFGKLYDREIQRSLGDLVE